MMTFTQNIATREDDPKQILWRQWVVYPDGKKEFLFSIPGIWGADFPSKTVPKMEVGMKVVTEITFVGA